MAWAHLPDGTDDRWIRPISMFRDGPNPASGYSIFAALAAVLACHLAGAMLAKADIETTALQLALVLLALTTATHSLSGTHLWASFGLILLIFLYIAFAWKRTRPHWLPWHFGVLAGSVLLSVVHEYGIWQKAFVSYSILAGLTTTHEPAPVSNLPKPRKRVARKKSKGAFVREP